MKKLIYFKSILLIIFFLNSCSKEKVINEKDLVIENFKVNETLAKNVAKTILSEKFFTYKSGAKVTESTTKGIKSIKEIIDKKNVAGDILYFIIKYYPQDPNNKNDFGGYSIISGDKRITPVLSYSEDGIIDDSNPGMNIMLAYYESQIEFAKKNLKVASAETNALWMKYEKSKGGKVLVCSPYDPYYPNCCPDPVSTANGPFLNTNWHQYSPYNDACPTRNCSNGKALAGCGPIAISQIMNFYTRPNIRTQFGISGPNKPIFSPALNYPFDDLNNNSGDRAALIREVGNLAGTNYFNYPNCNTMTWRENVKQAFQGAGYSNAGNRISYIGSFSSIESEILTGRPVIMDGTTGNVCCFQGTLNDWHIWVIDGYSYSTWYNRENGQCMQYTAKNFHMNWGWGESYNNWCAIFNLSGGGSNFNSYLNATYGMRP